MIIDSFDFAVECKHFELFVYFVDRLVLAGFITFGKLVVNWLLLLCRLFLHVLDVWCELRILFIISWKFY